MILPEINLESRYCGAVKALYSAAVVLQGS